MLRRLRSFVGLSGRRRALLVEAVAWLVVARWALAFLPFRRVARSLGTFVAPTDPRITTRTGAGRGDESTLAAEVGWAVARAAANVPFRAVCLPRAIAARMMLRRRGIVSVLHFGGMIGGGDPRAFEAHAWLDAAGVEVTGYPVARDMAEIACVL